MTQDADVTAREVATAEAALTRLREAAVLLDTLYVGPTVIHLDACIATLESRIAKAKAGELPLGVRKLAES